MTRAPLALAIPAALAPVLAPGAAAQQELYRYAEPSNPGLSAGPAGDVDGDGVPDAFYVSLNGDDRVFVVSGADGSFLHDGLPLSGYLGTTMALCGDVDGDGITDLIAGGPQSASAAVLSGLDGAILYQYQGSPSSQLGHASAGLGDRDGDGRDDFAIGAPGGPAGSVLVFHGADGGQSAVFQAPGARHFGASLALTLDVDEDGLGEILVGAPWTDPPGRDRTGAAYLLSGGDGTVLLELVGDFDRGYFGAAVAVAGDVDGDGTVDFLVGGTQEFESLENAPTGYADVRSGTDGRVLRRWFGSGSPDRFGFAVAGVDDVDGDGVADLAVAAPQDLVQGPGYVRVFSGGHGGLLLTLRGEAAVERGFGLSLGALGDLDGDGRSEIIVGAPAAGPGGDGHVYVFSLAPQRQQVRASPTPAPGR